MRIESSAPVRSEYRKSTGQTVPEKSFGQIVQARGQDRYVPGTRPQPSQTGVEFSRAERTYGGVGSVAASNATHAKLKQLAELDRQSDYTGMSPDEIYAEIWQRYDEAFDGNMVAISNYFAGPDEWTMVDYQFSREIMAHINYPVAAAARKAAQEADGKAYGDRSYEECRALDKFCQEKGSEAALNARWKVLGYDEMSFEEREAAIKEKYAGKNTTLDFLKMQGELFNSGVLYNKLGDGVSTYTDLIGFQFDAAYNPNSIYVVGPDSCDFMTADQWDRVANQPFDMAKFAASTKELLSQMSFSPDHPAGYASMIEKAIDQFMNTVLDKEMDRLPGMTEEN